MSKLLTIVLIAVIVYYGNDWSSESYDCQNLIGTWEGEHTYEDGTHHSWVGTNHPDGGADLVSTVKKGDEIKVESQFAILQCDGRVLTSTARNVSGGKTHINSFHIHELTEDTFRYQRLYEDEHVGPEYVSRKVRETHNNSLKSGTPQSGAP